MSAAQPDLFAAAPEPPPPVPPEVLDMVRARLHRLLALVRGAETMPWTDMLQAVAADNAFRSGYTMLPPEEGEPLWREFDAELDRLYAIANEGQVLD
ncbi:hypothetical protein [Plastoroseomonas arctica]|uniref:Uncharacterized protein n=1 Tax=Plastoroseomonas arctica TaxID=1509237 RepID=A0AAF1JUU3_9PROT|nr:hypothetical protein [Plastoroseomonas arctica]MBR0653931.1 hypothetical protein [Plastoroseomonas arctica]